MSDTPIRNRAPRLAPGTSCRDSALPVHELLGPLELDSELIQLCHSRAADLRHRIERRVRVEVAGFAPPVDSDVEVAITRAISQAVEAFMQALAGRPVDAGVYAYFRRLGVVQAEAGLDLDAIHAAHNIATQESWDELQQVTAEIQVPGEVVSAAGGAIMTFLRALLDHTVAGYMSGRNAGAAACETPTRLARELVSSNRTATVTQLAKRCGWTVPERVAVLAMSVVPGTGLPATVTCDLDAVWCVRNGKALVVVDADRAERVARALARMGARVSVTWGVPTSSSHQAARWAARALSLADQGLISADPRSIVRCREHQTLLALHADPALRRHADGDVLAPLVGLTTKRRADLAQTLLIWLQARPSAPVLAAQLGVHSQTARHRIKVLRELFGDSLTDKSQVLGLLAALQSVTPRWVREAEHLAAS